MRGASIPKIHRGDGEVQSAPDSIDNYGPKPRAIVSTGLFNLKELGAGPIAHPDPSAE